MEYRFKEGQRVRILDVPSLGERGRWAGREVTLKEHDIDGASWGISAWSVDDPDCQCWFRESEMAPLGPIRTETVTTRRLEPGVYGRLQVGGSSTSSEVRIALTSRGSDHDDLVAMVAPELRELARVALEIAEYLENA